MPRPIMHFNGRAFRWIDKKGVPEVQHGYIAARSKAAAVRMAKKITWNFSIRELNVYWSPVWGTFANENFPKDEEGLWVVWDEHSKKPKFERLL